MAPSGAILVIANLIQSFGNDVPDRGQRQVPVKIIPIVSGFSPVPFSLELELNLIKPLPQFIRRRRTDGTFRLTKQVSE